MTRTLLFTAAAALILAGTAPAGGPDDPEAKVKTARDAYQSGLEKAQATLMADLTRRAEAARRAGDLKGVETVQAEGRMFIDKGVLPKSVPTLAYSGEVGRVRSRFAEALRLGVREATRDGALDTARQIQKELDDLLNSYGPDRDTRASWAGRSRLFSMNANREWAERNAKGQVVFIYKEVKRTAEYVELRDNTRDVTLQLMANHAMSKKGRKPWQLLESGVWSGR